VLLRSSRTFFFPAQKQNRVSPSLFIGIVVVTHRFKNITILKSLAGFFDGHFVGGCGFEVG